MDFKYIFSPLDINNINKSYKMVNADATPKKTWMEFVKDVRNNNPGMALKDVLRLASKLRGKSSSGNSGKSSSGKSSSGKSQKQKQKKRGGMLLPMLGGATVDAPVGAPVDNAAKLTVAPEVVAGTPPVAPAPAVTPAPVAPVAAKLETIPEGDENNLKGGRKSKKLSKKSKKSRKSKSRSKKSKRRH